MFVWGVDDFIRALNLRPRAQIARLYVTEFESGQAPQQSPLNPLKSVGAGASQKI